jgi:hypothetical protein
MSKDTSGIWSITVPPVTPYISIQLLGG